MKAIKIILSFGAMVALALMLNGCGTEEAEKEKKKAEERGLVPKQTVDRAKQKIADVEEKMKDRLKQIE